MAFYPEYPAPEEGEFSPTLPKISGQKEITRSRILVALGFIQNTAGSLGWLERLNDVEFQALLTDILPALEYEKKRRGLT